MADAAKSDADQLPIRLQADTWILAMRRLAPGIVERWPKEDSSRVQILEWFGDVGLFVSAAARLRRAAALGVRHGDAGKELAAALEAFDKAAPDVVKMRDVGEHFDDYALGRGWHKLDVPIGVKPGELMPAAESLYAAIVPATDDPTPPV